MSTRPGRPTSGRTSAPATGRGDAPTSDAPVAASAPGSGGSGSPAPGPRDRPGAGAGPRGDRDRLLERAIVVGGLVVALALAVAVSLYGALLTPFRVGTTLVPVSLVIAVAGNIAVIWFAWTVTRNRGLAMLPAAVWFVLTYIAGMKTHDGDLLLIGSNWVATAYLLAGMVGIGIAAYWLFLFRRPS